MFTFWSLPRVARVPYKADVIDAEQIRAARAILDWSQQRLADEAGLSLGVVKKAEKDRQDIRVRSLQAIETVLSTAGILFLEEGDVRPGGKGVRRR